MQIRAGTSLLTEEKYPQKRDLKNIFSCFSSGKYEENIRFSRFIAILNKQIYNNILEKTNF